jgi:hypothetical protein
MTDPEVIAPVTLAMYGAFRSSSSASRKAAGDTDKARMPYYGEGDT